MPKTFTCHKLMCKGVTPAVCIGRQHKRRTGAGRTGYLYPICAEEPCSDGAAMAQAYPELVPDNGRPKPKPPADPVMPSCEWCGEPFKPNKKAQRYCGHSCAKQARPSKEITMVCLWAGCGREFVTLASHKRKYCSITCSTKGRVAYAKEGAHG